ncbi:hypothetical protein HA402_000296 [Bradysia odoriphaga]|nr:hypothetical protein HA402_000296 [Bradysia odoriphaga]
MSSNFDGILFGGSVLESLENAKSFGEFCYNRLKRHGQNVLYINGDTSERVTASQLLLGSIRVAECLQNYGIQAGDSVGICCENRFEVPYIMFAVFFIGATYVPLNPTYTEST